MSLNKAVVSTAGGLVSFGSVGAGYGTLLATTGRVRKIFLQNSLNQNIVVSLDGGTTNWMVLLAQKDLAIDFDTSLQFSGTISIKHNGVAPTSGAISAAIIGAL